MKKNVFGRRFKRDSNERKALFKSLMSALIIKERIQTTEEKAKAIKGQIEKLITKAKKGESSRYFLAPFFQSHILDKIVKELGPRFADRPGGYTRIIKLGRRFNDNAAMAVMEFVDRKIETAVARLPKGKKEKVFSEQSQEKGEKESQTIQALGHKEQSQAKQEKKEAKPIKSKLSTKRKAK